MADFSKRIRQLPTEVSPFGAQVLALDGAGQSTYTTLTLDALRTWLNIPPATGGGPSPATTPPLPDGPTALTGTSLQYARADHVHLQTAGGGGGGGSPLVNIGTGSGIYAGQSGVGESQLRSLKSTTSSLTLALSGGDIVFNIDVAALTAALAVATTSTQGAMSVADKLKLNTYPATYAAPVLASAGVGTDVYIGKVANVDTFRSIASATPSLGISVVADDITLSIASATPLASGLMTAVDKAKLDALEEGGGVTPGPGTVDFTLINGTATYIDFAAGTPDGAWLILADQTNPDDNCLVIADFVNGAVAFYTSGGLALVGAYNSFATATGVLAGTTGTAGKINISATANFRLYVENRKGSTVALRYFRSGSGGGSGGATSLDGLLDVQAPAPASGDVLTFDIATGFWKPLQPTGGGGGGGSFTNPATLGNEVAGNKTVFAYNTGTGEFTITTSYAAQSSVVQFRPDGDILIDGVSLKPNADLIAAINQVAVIADQARVYRDEAAAQALLAQRWASDPVGQVISGGLQSALSYAVQARNNAEISRISTVRVVTDADIVSGQYALRLGDLFGILAMRNTAACTVLCPPDLWLSNFGEAWVVIRREGQAVTLASMTGGSSAPLYMASRDFAKRFAAPTTGTTSFVEVLDVPPLSLTSKIVVMVNSSFDTAVAHTLSLAVTVGGLPVPTKFYDDGVQSGQDVIKQDAWQFNVASFVGAECSFQVTASAGLNALTGSICVIKNAGGRDQSVPFKSSGVSGLSSGSIVAAAAPRFVVGTFAQRSHNGLPATLGGGLLRLSQVSTVGTPSGNDSDRFRNMSQVVGYDLVSVAATRNYNSQFAFTDGPTAGHLVSYPVSNSTPVSSILRSAGARTTIAEADATGVLHLSPDGITYWFETAKP